MSSFEHRRGRTSAADPEPMASPARGSARSLRRVAAGMTYEQQRGFLAPGGPLTFGPAVPANGSLAGFSSAGRGSPVQMQDEGGPVDSTMDAMAGVGHQLGEAADLCEGASQVLDRVSFELLVLGQGPLSRQTARLKGVVDTLHGALSGGASRIVTFGRIRAVVDNVSAIVTNLQAAADTPIEASLIADDPRTALEGYTAYFRAAAIGCRMLGVVPGLAEVSGWLADLFDAIPNAVENLYRVFERYHERIDALMEDSQEVTYRFTPDTPPAVRLGNALMRDMRESPDIGYRRLPARVHELLDLPAIVASLTEEARERAAANANDLRDRFFAWLMADNAGAEPLQVEAVRTIRDRLDRFMLGTGSELRSGTPFTMIGQLAMHGSAEAATRHLLMASED